METKGSNLWLPVPDSPYEMNALAQMRRRIRSPGRSVGLYSVPQQEPNRARCFNYAVTLLSGRRGHRSVRKLYRIVFPEKDDSFLDQNWLAWARNEAFKRNEAYLAPRREIHRKGAHKYRKPHRTCRYCGKGSSKMFCRTCEKLLTPEAKLLMEKEIC